VSRDGAHLDGRTLPTYLIDSTVQRSPLQARKTFTSPSAVVTEAMTLHGLGGATLGDGMDGHTISVEGNSIETAVTTA
jgi:hypothetical protein